MKTIKLHEIEEQIGYPKTIEVLTENNQILYCPNGSWFISYGKIIGAMFNGHYAFSKLHDYSKTTCKYCKKWCYLTTAERRKALDKELAFLIED